MKNIINKNKYTHWYNKDGKPEHETGSADGTKKVKTTVIHARKKNLYPSVTSVLKIIHKEELETWKQAQLIKACIALPLNEGESDDSYTHRVVDMADSISQEAMKFGIAVHYFVENYLSKEVNFSEIPMELQTLIVDTLDKHIKEAVCEKVLCSEQYGYAGTSDIQATEHDGSIVRYEIKTQKTFENKPFKVYKEWLLQLGAYDLIEPSDKYKVLMVSSTENRVEIHEYNRQDVIDAQKAFLAALDLFKFIKGI